MTAPALASSNGMFFDVLGWVFVAALLIVALYFLIGIVLLPVWGAGAVLHADRLAAWGRGWWWLPFAAYERGGRFVDDLTRPRTDDAYASAPSSEAEQREAHSGDWAKTLGQIVSWVLAIVGGLWLLMSAQDSIIRPLVGGSAGDAVVILAAVLTAGAAGTTWVLSQRHPVHRQRPPAFRFAIAATVVLGFLTYLFITELQASNRLVSDYCAYGSVSQAQLDGCKGHVTADDVRSRDTPAARFAQSDSSDDVCGAGSGPFCAHVLENRYLEDQQPPPGQ
jgi:hypothetical protein